MVDTLTQLISYTNAPEDIQRQSANLVTFMALGHDYGNLENRKNHANLSTDYLAMVAPELTENAELFAMIKRGIELHDSSEIVGTSGSHFFKYWLTGESAHLSDADKAFADDDRFRIAFCAFYMSDKVDFGPQRLNRRVTTLEAFADPFNKADFFARSQGIHPEGKDMVWDIEFNGGFYEEEFQQFGQLQPEKLSLQEWVQLYNDIYKTRSYASPIFTLYPDMQSFMVRFIDQHKLDKAGVPVIKTYQATRDNLTLRDVDVHQEIERKWVVDDNKFPEKFPHDVDPSQVQDIIQVYVAGTDERIRQIITHDNKISYLHTVKTGEGIERKEVEREATQEEFLNAMANNQNSRIKKTRYKLPYTTQHGEVYLIELDKFDDNNTSVDGHWVAEIEFASSSNANTFGEQKPVWFGEDVSQIKGFGNKDLANKGWPRSETF